MTETITQKLGNEMTVAEYRDNLHARRESLRGLYARFRDAIIKLESKSLVRYNRERHAYENCIHAAGRSVSLKERNAVAIAIKLQINISQQAVLLLELEHAIDHEERQRRNQ